ncbi:Fc.00g095060.m01.CDS01 [Cosmosporella sp. VM-42]
MQAVKGQADVLGRKAKLARSYQELLDEFSSKDLKSVGTYTLGRLIGKGSFGKVYLATHKLTNGSKVVLKSANKGDSNLAREIHHHRQFIHPHIARLYEVIVTESLVWLVLEYCPGDELYNHLLEHGPLPVSKVQKIFAQLVGAVSYVHMHSCVHRDLKLENILFDKHENVKLVDFGFTREYEGRINHLQTFCGTICYSAPEMLKGEKYAGEKVDVWSLGIILYALLCGELPFDDDDDNVTRTKILLDEPKYPEHLPPDAIPLLKALLSKRPLLRPTLPDILTNPFLAEHAPAQQTILDIKPNPPFSTPLEKECLERMRSAGVNIDAVIESILAQKCDTLAGWWALLLEKEQRKMKRREKKRKEREAESRSIRRLSAASSRLERIAPMLHDVDEEGGLTRQFIKLEHSGSRSRGRSERRSAHYADYTIPDLPQLLESGKEPGAANRDGDYPPPPIDKDSIRSASTSRHRRPIPPPKEGLIRSARSRGSTLHLVTTSDALTSNGSQQASSHQKPRKKPSQAIIAHWKNWTHWFFENTTRRRRGHERRTSRSTPDLHSKTGSGGSNKDASPRPQTSKYPASGSPRIPPTAGLPKGVSGVISDDACKSAATNNHFAVIQTTIIVTITIDTEVYDTAAISWTQGAQIDVLICVIREVDASPSPFALEGFLDKFGSILFDIIVQDASPTRPFSTSFRKGASSYPNGGLLSIQHPVGMPSGGPSAPGSPNPFASGIMFAKRKRNLFKGPTLNFGGAQNNQRNTGSGSHSRSASASGLGRRSGEITIQEEDEAEEEEEIEEVDMFSPVISRPGETIEEQIFEDNEPTPTKDGHVTAAEKQKETVKESDSG